MLTCTHTTELSVHTILCTHRTLESFFFVELISRSVVGVANLSERCSEKGWAHGSYRGTCLKWPHNECVERLGDRPLTAPSGPSRWGRPAAPPWRTRSWGAPRGARTARASWAGPTAAPASSPSHTPCPPNRRPRTLFLMGCFCGWCYAVLFVLQFENLFKTKKNGRLGQ